jgi:hypothetical protein
MFFLERKTFSDIHIEIFKKPTSSPITLFLKIVLLIRLGAIILIIQKSHK